MKKIKSLIIGSLFIMNFSAKAQDCLPIIEACDSTIMSQEKEIQNLTIDRDFTRQALRRSELENEKLKKSVKWQKTKTKITEIALIIMAICGSIVLIID